MPDDFVPVFISQLRRAMPAGFLRPLIFNGRRQPSAFSPAPKLSLKLNSHGGESVGDERSLHQEKLAELPLLFRRRFAGGKRLLEFLKGLNPQHHLLVGSGALRVFEARKVSLQIVTFLKHGGWHRCAVFARQAVIEIDLEAVKMFSAGIALQGALEKHSPMTRGDRVTEDAIVLLDANRSEFGLGRVPNVQASENRSERAAEVIRLFQTMRRDFIQRDRRLPRFRRNGKQMLRVAIPALPRAFGQVRAQGLRERVKRPGFGHAAAAGQCARGGDIL